jgi:methyl-accepting chemotaxis protein
LLKDLRCALPIAGFARSFNMIANLKIGTRLALGFGLLLALLGGVAALAVSSLGALAGTTEVIVKDRYPQVVLATGILLQVSENATAMRNMLLVDDRDKLNAEIGAIQNGEKSIADKLAKLEALLSSEGGRKAHQDILALRAKYRAGQDEFMKMAATGATLDATALLLSTLRRDQQAYVDRIKDFIEGGGRLMDRSGEEAAAQYRSRTIFILALTGIAIVLACAFAFRIARSIIVPLRHAVAVAKTVATGNLTSEIALASKDEIGELMQALGEMNEGLRGIVGGVRAGTETIAGASREIASGNLDLSARTEQQAAALEETSSAMEQLAAAVARNADSAQEANRLATTASEVAAASSKVVTEVIDTMREIAGSSDRIVDIIAVIDGIAFQTNILALNAAVEAARAGEQGRGFAVVASEVRSLAQRSASAAKEIKSLIDGSAGKVERGSRLVEQAGATMHEVVASVDRVTAIVGDIALASREQQTGIGHVNQAVGQMDQGTQQNAALVEQAAAAAQALREQAGRLAELVSVFRIAARDDGAAGQERIAASPPPARLKRLAA